MGRKLTPEERGRRLVGKVHIRELASHGKCQICKNRVPKGQKSLRYMELVFGRKQEVGICMGCASTVWPAAEDTVGRVSAEIQAYQESKGDQPPEPAALVAEVQKPDPQPAPQTDTEPVLRALPEPTPEDHVAEVAQNRETLMKEFFGKRA